MAGIGYRRAIDRLEKHKLRRVSLGTQNDVLYQGETVTRDIAPLLAAERDAGKIAGAINSFVGSSPGRSATCLRAAGPLPHFAAL